MKWILLYIYLLMISGVIFLERRQPTEALLWVVVLVCLPSLGAVLYLVIGFYPALAGSLGTGGSITEQAWAMLGQSVILQVAVFMSGKFTKAKTYAKTKYH